MYLINSAKNLCDEGATNDIVIGRFLKAQGNYPSKLVVAALAAKILHSATLRPKFASQTLSNCTFGSPNKCVRSG